MCVYKNLSKCTHASGGTCKGGTLDKGESLSGEEGSGGSESHDGRNCELHWKWRPGCQAFGLERCGLVVEGQGYSFIFVVGLGRFGARLAVVSEVS